MVTSYSPRVPVSLWEIGLCARDGAHLERNTLERILNAPRRDTPRRDEPPRHRQLLRTPVAFL